MKNTKEEILNKIYKRSVAHVPNADRIKITNGSMFVLSEALEAMDEYTTHLTDQIKSMEGQVKELSDENEKLIRANQVLIDDNGSMQSQLESLQKEADSNVVEFARWLCVNKWKSENGIYYEKGFGFLKEPELKKADELYKLFKQ